MCSSLDRKTSRLGFVALLLVLGLAEVAAGSCLSYGHSCWGAHGKRSGARSQEKFVVPENAEESVAVAAPEDTRWFLAPMVDGATGSESWRSSEETDSAESAARTAEDSAARPGVDFPQQEERADVSADMVLMPALDQQNARRIPHKLRLYKILKRASRNMN
nr:CCHamide 1 [Carausius morosus]